MKPLSESLNYDSCDTLEDNLFFEMLLIRKIEQKVESLFTKGIIFGTCHCSIGQEAPAVAIINNLNLDDMVFSNHRGHGHFITFTKNLEGFFLEIIGNKKGVCGGRGGSQHLNYGNFFSNGITAGMVPVAAGASLGKKYEGKGNIVAVMLGEGALGQGVVYESMNIASLWSLPLLFVIENNQYAMSTSISEGLAGSIQLRAQAFNIDYTYIEDLNLMDLFQKSQKIINEVRKFPKPHLIIVNTYRFCGHSKSDDRVYRTADEEEHWLKKDPINLIKTTIGLERLNKIEEAVNNYLDTRLEKILPGLHL